MMTKVPTYPISLGNGTLGCSQVSPHFQGPIILQGPKVPHPRDIPQRDLTHIPNRYPHPDLPYISQKRDLGCGQVRVYKAHPETRADPRSQIPDPKRYTPNVICQPTRMESVMTIPANLKAARVAIPLIDAHRIEALYLAPGRPNLRALAKAGVPMLALRWTAATAAYTRAVREYLQGDPARRDTLLEWVTSDEEASQPAN